MGSCLRAVDRDLAAVGVALLSVALLFAAAAPARASEPTAVAGFGLVGLEPGENRAAVFELEYRFRPWRFGIGPLVGAAMTSDGSSYVRAGLGRDFPFARRWNVNVSSAAGAYQHGHGKRLGRGLEFRSAIDLSVEVRPGVRCGAALAHLSNAGIGRSNPGIETLTFTLSFVPGRMAARR